MMCSNFFEKHIGNLGFKLSIRKTSNERTHGPHGPRKNPEYLIALATSKNGVRWDSVPYLIF